jgi:uncharacterized protein
MKRQCPGTSGISLAMTTDTINTTFSCRRCGNCCRWPGEVRVDTIEVVRIADFLRLPEADFIARHTAVTRDRQGLTLLEKADSSCAFLKDDNSCALQAVKPRQCSAFPFGWRAPEFEHLCAGLRANTAGGGD